MAVEHCPRLSGCRTPLGSLIRTLRHRRSRKFYAPGTNPRGHLAYSSCASTPSAPPGILPDNWDLVTFWRSPASIECDQDGSDRIRRRTAPVDRYRHPDTPVSYTHLRAHETV